MKKEKFLQLFEGIDEVYIDEASPEKAARVRKNVKLRKAIMSSSAAACLLCGLTIGIGYYHMPPVSVIDPSETNDPIETAESRSSAETVDSENPPSVQDDPLPPFDIADADMAMGFEAYNLHDISELLTGNAIECGSVNQLSVYRNKLTYDERMRPSGQDTERMKSWMCETVKKLGMDLSVLLIKDNVPTGQEREMLEKEFEGRYQSAVPDYYFVPSMMFVEDDRYSVEVTADMTLTIHFKEAVPLPDEYRSISFTDTEDVSAFSSYLWAEFGNIIGYENPGYFITGGNYNIDQEQSYELFFFDKGTEGTIRESIFNYTHFGFTSDGKLMMIRIHAYSETLDELAKYPLIGREEAESRLLRGEYYSSVMEYAPKKENIHRVELVYRNGSNAKIIMPFYKFYAEIPERKEGDLRLYGTYYVPAVDQPYDSKSTDDTHYNLP